MQDVCDVLGAVLAALEGFPADGDDGGLYLGMLWGRQRRGCGGDEENEWQGDGRELHRDRCFSGWLVKGRWCLKHSSKTLGLYV